MEFIKNVIRGITIGIANVVPGVSGGTIMVSLGIYDELLHKAHPCYGIQSLPIG